VDGIRLQKPVSFFEKLCGLAWCKSQHALSWLDMKKLELLEQELATLRAAQQRDRAVQQQQACLIEQKDALLSEQLATIRKQSEAIRQQEEKLAAQQLEINRLIQQAFGRRSERYLESPQQLKLDFGGYSRLSMKSSLPMNPSLPQRRQRRPAQLLRRRRKRSVTNRFRPICRVSKRSSMCLRATRPARRTVRRH
jgi:hypothetical protein